jgi:hypothetical protein
MKVRTLLNFAIYGQMIFIRTFATNTIRCTNLMRTIIIFDNKMPSLYLEKNIIIDDDLKHKLYSIEHIFPRSHMLNSHAYDMHNIIKTTNNLNVNRSNYQYTDTIDDDRHWIKLDHDNYVNHKKRLFIPNKSSRGFISRAILYMTREYDYNFVKVIKKDVLQNWFYEHPPTKSEIYHNDIIKKLQHTNNVFISNYNKKKSLVTKYINEL